MIPSRRSTLSRIGDAVTNRRQAAGMSQEQLADASGLHRTYISAVERGRRNPTIVSLVAITHGLECTVEQIAADAGL